MRFHVVSLPHTNTTAEFPACAFTQKVIRFCAMMMARGHEVYLYSGDKNDAPCTEHISCIGEDERSTSVGTEHYTSTPWDITKDHWRHFNHRAANAIRKRAMLTDFLCVIGGAAHKPIADALPGLKCIEFGIGYGGTFAEYRVFESYAWMHAVYGAATMGGADRADGKWYDAVIPNQVDEDRIALVNMVGTDMLDDDELTSGEDIRGQLGPLGWTGPDAENPNGRPSTEAEEAAFVARTDRTALIHNLAIEPYFIYVGRLIDRKGYRIAQDVCKRLGARLILAGSGPQDGYGQFIGEVNEWERNYLMRRAIALLAPTIYIEPFGTVTIEAMANGCPVITSDWGAFTETVKSGDGWRCRMFHEFMSAASEALDRFTIEDQSERDLDRLARSERAIDRFSMRVVGKQYEDYFHRLETLWTPEGWYHIPATE